MKKCVQVFACIMLILLVTTGCKQTKVNNEEEIKEFIEAYNTNSSFPYNGTILVTKDNKVLISEGYGLANTEDGMKNREDLVFPIGSITKSFTATAIMQLVEKNHLNLDDNVADYIKNFDKSKGITLHHLLTHTSGLPREGKVSFTHSIPLSENIEYICKQELLFNPGSDFIYSNAGYILLAKVIEAVSGMPYNEYLNRNIFDPLDMTNSRGGKDATYSKNQAIGYTLNGDEFIRQSIYDFSIVTGSGNIYSTVDDLKKFISSFIDYKLLSEESVNTMTKNQSGHDKFPYGYGWEILSLGESKKISHSGNIGRGGYNSLIIHYKKHNLTLILLSNISNATATKVVSDSVAAICLGDGYVTPKVIDDSFTSNEELKNLTGKYSFNEDFFFKVTYKNNSLFITADDGNHYELLPVSKNTFQYKSKEWIEATFNIEKTKITLTIKNVSNSFKFVKLIN